MVYCNRIVMKRESDVLYGQVTEVTITKGEKEWYVVMECRSGILY